MIQSGAHMHSSDWLPETDAVQWSIYPHPRTIEDSFSHVASVQDGLMRVRVRDVSMPRNTMDYYPYTDAIRRHLAAEQEFRMRGVGNEPV
jgi:hypothetical protein